MTDQRCHVLCIDDSPEMTLILRFRLARYGLNVVCEQNGTEGYKTALELLPIVVVTDWTMPEGNGEYLLKKLKSNPITTAIPVIVLSGHSNPEIQHAILNHGASIIVKKPFSFDDLLQKLGLYLALGDR